MRAFLLRAFPGKVNRLSEFLENNVIAIGWSNCGDLSGKSLDQLREVLHAEYPHASDPAKDLSVLNIFVNEMSVGDYVFVPNPAASDNVHIGVIEGEYLYNTNTQNLNEDWVNQRKVKWIDCLSRNSFPEKLGQACRSRRTSVELTKYIDDIHALLNEKAANLSPDDITVRFPLRKDYYVSLTVPSDMTGKEARRLSELVLTLAMSD